MEEEGHICCVIVQTVASAIEERRLGLMVTVNGWILFAAIDVK